MSLAAILPVGAALVSLLAKVSGVGLAFGERIGSLISVLLPVCGTVTSLIMLDTAAVVGARPPAVGASETQPLVVNPVAATNPRVKFLKALGTIDVRQIPKSN